MTSERSYKSTIIVDVLPFSAIKPAKRVFIRDSIKYGGTGIAVYLITGLALRLFGVA